MIKKLIPLITILLLAGCPDPSLLRTDLPNGYSFHSNGGSFGYIARPNGERMAEYFGILDDGIEQWCNEFGWQGNYVVCELEVVKSDSDSGILTKYFMMNTVNEDYFILSNGAELEKKWREIVKAKLPKLSIKHPRTKRK